MVKYLNQHLDFLEVIIKLFSIHDDLYTDGHEILFAPAELFRINLTNLQNLTNFGYVKFSILN